MAPVIVRLDGPERLAPRKLVPLIAITRVTAWVEPVFAIPNTLDVIVQCNNVPILALGLEPV